MSDLCKYMFIDWSEKKNRNATGAVKKQFPITKEGYYHSPHGIFL